MEGWLELTCVPSRETDGVLMQVCTTKRNETTNATHCLFYLQ